MNDEEVSHLIDLVEEFPEVFHLPGDNLQATPNIKHKIPTDDDVPIDTRQYRFPPVHKEEIAKQISAKLSRGIIEFSSSPFNSPL